MFDNNDNSRKTAIRYLQDNLPQERTVELSTITYNDLNNEPADMDINVVKNYTIPNGYYIDKVFVEVIQPFDVAVAGIDLIVQGAAASFYNTNYPYKYWKQNDSSANTDTEFMLHTNFDVGNGEVNPQNATQGLIKASALIKKYPE